MPTTRAILDAIKHAAEVSSREEDESEPYKHKYVAADLLREVLGERALSASAAASAESSTAGASASTSQTSTAPGAECNVDASSKVIDDNEPAAVGAEPSPLDVAKAAARIRCGLILLETDLLPEGEAGVTAGLPVLEKSPEKYLAWLLESYNALGALYSQRGDMPVALQWLQKAERLYQLVTSTGTRHAHLPLPPGLLQAGKPAAEAVEAAAADPAFTTTAEAVRGTAPSGTDSDNASATASAAAVADVAGEAEGVSSGEGRGGEGDGAAGAAPGGGGGGDGDGAGRGSAMGQGGDAGTFTAAAESHQHVEKKQGQIQDQEPGDQGPGQDAEQQPAAGTAGREGGEEGLAEAQAGATTAPAAEAVAAEASAAEASAVGEAGDASAAAAEPAAEARPAEAAATEGDGGTAAATAGGATAETEEAAAAETTGQEAQAAGAELPAAQESPPTSDHGQTEPGAGQEQDLQEQQHGEVSAAAGPGEKEEVRVAEVVLPACDKDAVQSQYTSTMFFLAQVYGHMKVADRSALYCAATLYRQLASGKYDLDMWVNNCLQLGGYYAKVHAYGLAMYCHAAAQAVVDRDTAAGAELGEDIAANIKLAAARVYNMRLAASHAKHIECKELEVHYPDVSYFPEYLRFAGLALPSPDSFPWGLDALAGTFEAARDLLNNGMPYFKAALSYYQLDGWVTDHVGILMDMSNMYRCLASFEADPGRAAAMHRCRAQLLEPLSGALNPDHYPGLSRSIDLELAHVYREVSDVREVQGGQANKVASAAAAASKYYQRFLQSFVNAETGKLPDRVDLDNEPYFLMASFGLGRMMQRMKPAAGPGGAPAPDASFAALAIAAHRHLQWTSEYVKRHGLENWTEEAKAAEELSDLLVEQMRLKAMAAARAGRKG